MDLAELKKPFPPEDIEWRLAQAGQGERGIWARCLAYITSRAVMERLDQACGPTNWRDEYAPGPAGGVLCGLSIRIDDEWVTKYDAAENTQVEPVKGGISDALKRAAVKWGIGRYLYRLPEGWADVREDGHLRGKTKDGKWFHWNPPRLPEWALPGSAGKPSAEDAPEPPRAPEPAPERPQNAPTGTAPSGRPAGYRFEMDEKPTYRNGNHVFVKGPHREKWDGWTWGEMAARHVEAMRGGEVNSMNSPIANMLASNFVKGWLREMAEAIDRDAQRKVMAEHRRPTGTGAESLPKEEDEFDLDSVPF